MGRFGRHDRRLCSLRRPIFRLLDHLRLHGDARGVSQPLLQAPVLGVQRGDPFGLLAYLLLELLKFTAFAPRMVTEDLSPPPDAGGLDEFRRERIHLVNIFPADMTDRELAASAHPLWAINGGSADPACCPALRGGGDGGVV